MAPPMAAGRVSHDVDSDAGHALLQERYLALLSTMMLAGTAVPLLYFASVVAHPGTPRRLARQHAAVVAFLTLAAALAAALKSSRLAKRHGTQRLLRVAVLAETVSAVLINAAVLNEIAVLLGPSARVGDIASAFFWGPHLAMATRWVNLQLPAVAVFAPELARSAAMVLHLVCLAAKRGWTRDELGACVAYGAASVAWVPLLVSLCQERRLRAWQERVGVVTGALCPPALRGFRDALCAAYASRAEAWLPEALLDYHSVLSLQLGAVLLHCARSGRGLGPTVAHTAATFNLLLAAALAASAATRLSGSAPEALRLLEQRLGGASAQSQAGAAAQAQALAQRLGAAVSEHDLLRAASEAAADLWPDAACHALGTLGGAEPGAIALLEVAAVRDADRRALQAALQSGAARPSSSVAFVCDPARAAGAATAHSDDWQPEGVRAFSDWAAALEAGLSAERIITARISSGPLTVGFVVLCWRKAGAAGFRTGDADAAAALTAFAESVGDAVLVRRARDAAEVAARDLTRAQTLARDIYPPHLVAAMTARMEDGQELHAEEHEMVTCVFADCVSFTRTAGGMSSKDTMRLLDGLFTRFDTLTSSNGLYKVETVGDSYFAISGMLPSRPDHARAALRFALDLHDAAEATQVPGGQYKGERVRIRVGLHSGPVTSGVIGHLRARFCVFGDTVNVASRMESTGRAGAVQLSAAAAAACALPPGLLEPIELDVKGVGKMQTFVVQSGAEAATKLRAALAVSESASASARSSARRRWSKLAASLRAARFLAAGKRGIRKPNAADLINALVPLVPPGSAAGGYKPPPSPGVGTLTPGSIGFGYQTSPSFAPGSVSGASTGTRDGAADADSVLNHLALRHLEQQIFTIWLPPMLFHAVNAAQVQRWLDGGVPGAAQVMSVYRPVFFAGFSGFFAFLAAVAVRSHVPAVRAACGSDARWGAAVVWLQAALMLHTSVTHTVEVLLDGDACGLNAAQCMRLQFWRMHLGFVPMLWIQAGLPVRLIVFPEALRSGLYLAMALFAAYRYDALTPAFAAGAAAEAVLAAALVPFVTGVCVAPTQAVSQLLTRMDTMPAIPALIRFRDAVLDAVRAASARLFRGAALMDEQSGVIVAAQGMSIVAETMLLGRTYSLRAVGARLRSTAGLVLLGSAMTKLRPSGDTPNLDALATSMRVAEEQRSLRALRAALASTRSEAVALRAAGDALRQLFPGASGWAVGAFAEGAGADVIAALEAGPDDAARSAMVAALPPGVGSHAHAERFGATAVHAACSPHSVAPLLDSRELPGGGAGVSAHSDWAAAAALGTPSAQAVTCAMRAGPRLVGFVTLHFGAFSAVDRAQGWSALTEFADCVGGALFVGRAFALTPSAPVAEAPPAEARPPETAAPAEAVPREAEEDAAMLAALDASAATDGFRLRAWSLDPWQLPDDELRRLCVAMFHSLGLLRNLRLQPRMVAAFCDAVAEKMRDNHFHCWRHCWTVTHACYLFLIHSGLRSRFLRDCDVLALLLAALCHDLEHAGVTNSFHVSTGSALALRYHECSVLESHHAACALELLQRIPLLAPLAQPERAEVRKTVVAAVLATDMAVHGDLLARVRARIEAAAAAGAGAAAGFKRDSEVDRRTIVAFLLHAADLSNPLFPPAVSQRIAEGLAREFANQAEMERAQGLPISVMIARDRVTQATNEVGFISAVVSPLYTTLAALAPPLRCCLALVDANRVAWEQCIAAEGASA